MSKPAWEQVGVHMRALSADDSVRCVIIRGAGTKAFAAGADIAEFENERANVEQARAYGRLIQSTMDAIAECRHPTIAMIHGVCVGGGLELAPLISRGLAMGDEMHQRNVACSALTLRALSPHLARAAGTSEELARALAFIAGNEQFFLNVGMAMGKAVMDPVKGIEACSLVSAMCRNGTDFGVRLSATGERWYTAPVEMPQGLYFPGYSEKDANPDMGDSAIMETLGLGAFAMAAAPAVMGFVGAGRASDALTFTRAMGEITAGQIGRAHV